MRRFFFIALILLLLIPTGVRGEGAKIISEKVITSFPTSITFELEISGDVSDVLLLYRVRKKTLIPITCIAFPELSGKEIKRARWVWDMRRMGGLPPGAEILYRWVVNRRAGDWKEITFKDERKRWKSLRSENIIIFWERGGEEFGRALLREGEKALWKITEEMGIDFEGEIKVYVYGSTRELREALIFPKEWTGGMAFPPFGTVVLGISPENLAWGKRALRHEIGHLVIHSLTRNPFSDIPRWLDEGFAMNCEGEVETRWWGILTEGLKRGRLFSLKSLSGNFPEDAWEASLSYAESLFFFRFLIERWGWDRLKELLLSFREGMGQDEALKKVYGKDADGMYKMWLLSIREASLSRI